MSMRKQIHPGASRPSAPLSFHFQQQCLLLFDEVSLICISHRQAKLDQERREQERREKEEEEARQRRLLEEQRARQREEEEREVQARLRAAQEKAQEEERRRRQQEEEEQRRKKEEEERKRKEAEERERWRNEEPDGGGHQPVLMRASKLTTYRALYSFVARNTEELSVDADCLIEVTLDIIVMKTERAAAAEV